MCWAPAFLLQSIDDCDSIFDYRSFAVVAAAVDVSSSWLTIFPFLSLAFCLSSLNSNEGLQAERVISFLLGVQEVRNRRRNTVFTAEWSWRLRRVTQSFFICIFIVILE